MRTLEDTRRRRKFKKERIMEQEEREKKLLETVDFLRWYDSSSSEDEVEAQDESEYETEAEVKLDRSLIQQNMVNCIKNLFKYSIEPKYGVSIRFVEVGYYQIIYKNKIIGEFSLNVN